jgi:hypothetical protein
MPLRDLDDQARVLARLDDYFTELSAQKVKADKLITADTTTPVRVISTSSRAPTGTIRM